MILLLGQVCMHWPDQSSQEQTALGKAETVRIGQVTVKLVLQHHAQTYFSSTIPHTATLQFHRTTYSNASVPLHHIQQCFSSTTSHTTILQFHHTAYSNTSVPPHCIQQHFSSTTIYPIPLSLPPAPYGYEGYQVNLKVFFHFFKCPPPPPPHTPWGQDFLCYLQDSSEEE